MEYFKYTCMLLIKWNRLLSCDPAILLSGIYSRERKTYYVHTNTSTRLFKATLFIMALNWKELKRLSMGEWINNRWCLHNGIIVSHKTEQITRTYNNMVNSQNHYTEQSKTDTDPIYVKSKNKQHILWWQKSENDCSGCHGEWGRENWWERDKGNFLGWWIHSSSCFRWWLHVLIENSLS